MFIFYGGEKIGTRAVDFLVVNESSRQCMKYPAHKAPPLNIAESMGAITACSSTLKAEAWSLCTCITGKKQEDRIDD